MDFEGAVKVYDAMEAANVKRLLYVGAIDVRTRKGDYPEYYNEASSEWRMSVWCSDANQRQGRRVIKSGLPFQLVGPLPTFKVLLIKSLFLLPLNLTIL